MIINLEVFPLPNGVDQVRLQAEVQLDDAVALRTSQMVMVVLARAQAKGMRSISKLDTIQYLHPHELLD